MTERHSQTIPLTRARVAVRLGLVAGAAACTLALAGPAPYALAVDSDTFAVPSSNAAVQPQDEPIEVDLLGNALVSAKTDEAVSSVKACSMQLRANALKAMEPLQRERSNQAARELYKAQQNSYEIIDMVTSAQSLDEFIRQGEYYERATRHNIEEINRLKELGDAAEAAETQAETAKSEAVANVASASEALLAAQQERADRAALAIADAQMQAVTLGGSKSISRLLSDDEIKAAERGEPIDQPVDQPVDSEEKPSASSKSKSSGASAKADKKSSRQSEEVVEYSEPAMTDTEPLADGANWFMSREEFLAEWTPRLDAYLAGSPLEGQGVNFAKSAWRHCIDPRWSAAISNTESSKARICIRPHNAWGWGAADSDPYNLAAEWGSWEEAIEAHTRGLANGYGYTITIRGAQTYCPYNWQSWYNNTLTEMASI